MDWLPISRLRLPDREELPARQVGSFVAHVNSSVTNFFRRYQGDMSRTQRDQAVKVFMAKEKARVMLMSLKCGGMSPAPTNGNF